MAMHPIMKQALAGLIAEPRDELSADDLDTIEAIASNGQTGRLTAYEVRLLVAAYRASQAQRQALEQCQKALAMMIAPDAIRQTTTINAFEQCTAAELAARKALGKDAA